MNSNTDNKPPTIVFAGGGTGGHLSPGLAIAEHLETTKPEINRVFACSNRSIDTQMLGDADETIRVIDASPFGKKPNSIFSFIKGWFKAKKQADLLFNSIDAKVVISLGGFVAAPVVKVAANRGIHTVLLNLDAVPGKANRLIARNCDEILSVCDTPTFNKWKYKRVSMPLRSTTLSPGNKAHCRKKLGLDEDKNTLIITGASQGSQSLNELLMLIANTRAELLDGWQVFHLSGNNRGELLSETYERAGIRVIVRPFEKNMGLIWGAADLAISRAGANSVAEIAANTVPAIFFPYPFHKDQHQFENAQPLVEIGGAIALSDHIEAEFNLKSHGEILAELLGDIGRRDSMYKALEENRPTSGASEVAEILLSRI